MSLGNGNTIFPSNTASNKITMLNFNPSAEVFIPNAPYFTCNPNQCTQFTNSDMSGRVLDNVFQLDPSAIPFVSESNFLKSPSAYD